MDVGVRLRAAVRVAALVAACACATALTPAAANADASVSTCAAQAAAAAATADRVERVTGVVVLTGCAVDDASGIAQVRVEAAQEADGGAPAPADFDTICADPPHPARWRCRWDTAALEPGRYMVRITAVDNAGNEGSFDRSFDVVAPQPSAVPDDPGGADTAPSAGDEAPPPSAPDPPPAAPGAAPPGSASPSPATAPPPAAEPAPSCTPEGDASCLAAALRLLGAADVTVDAAAGVIRGTLPTAADVAAAGSLLRPELAGWRVELTAASPEPPAPPDTQPTLTADPLAAWLAGTLPAGTTVHHDAMGGTLAIVVDAAAARAALTLLVRDRLADGTTITIEAPQRE